MASNFGTKPLIVYWNNIPSPYMVERFNALVDRDAFEFEAWFNDRISSDRSWVVDESNWRFHYRYLPRMRFLGHMLHWPLPSLGRRPDVLVSLYAEPSFIVGWAIAKLRGTKTVFWCVVTHDSWPWIARNSRKELLKRLIFARVDATLGPGEEAQKYAMRYGVTVERALCLRHSIDVDHFTSGYKKYFLSRESIRSEVGVNGTVFVYVGRLWWAKGIKYLMQAFKRVQDSSDKEVSLLLVGDGSEEEKLRQMCGEHYIRNVIFSGFQQKENLPLYYVAADVFVFPTLGDTYGLVVDEAMACSLPVISTSAVGEIRDRVEDGANGYIVPPEDSAALAGCMMRFVNKPDLCKKMGIISAKKIAGHTPEKWAKDFEEIIEKMIGK